MSKPACGLRHASARCCCSAGELTPVEKAERRVLILSDPGRGPGAMRVAGPIFCGMQLLLPGEKAPAHRHTPSAARIVVEGEGAYHHRQRREMHDGARRPDPDAGRRVARPRP